MVNIFVSLISVFILNWQTIVIVIQTNCSLSLQALLNQSGEKVGKSINKEVLVS